MLLTVREVALRLRVSPGVIYTLVSQKRIRHERMGSGRGVIRIPEEAVEEYRQSVTVAVSGGGSPKRPAPARPKLKHLSLS